MVRLRIKEEALAQNMKQYELVQRSGCTGTVVNRYWNNNIQRIDLEELGKIARALNVPPGDLIVSDDINPQI